MNILAVVSDMAGAAMVGPVVELMRGRKDTVFVVAPGKATGAFGAMGVVVNIPEGISCDVANIFNSFCPDALFLGTSSPVNGEAAECAFLNEANNRSLPTFIFADTYGAEVRLGGLAAKHWIVVDEEAAKIAGRLYPSASFLCAGHGTIKGGEIDPKALAFVQGLSNNHGRVHVWSSGRTFDDLELMVKCMERTSGCLVPLFHPKVRKEIALHDDTYEDQWMELLHSILNRVVFQPEGMPSDNIVRALSSVNGVFASGFSGMAVNAAYHGVTTVALRTPGVTDSLFKQTGLLTLPLVDMGLAHVVMDPCRLNILQPLLGDSLQPYNPALVLAWVDTAMKQIGRS